jgi:hypothetical protein
MDHVPRTGLVAACGCYEFFDGMILAREILIVAAAVVYRFFFFSFVFI